MVDDMLSVYRVVAGDGKSRRRASRFDFLPQNDTDAILAVMPTMDRATMNISLPASLKTWVDEQAERGDFGTASEYIRHLLRAARQRQIHESTEAQLLAGLDSGPPTGMKATDWSSIRRAGKAKLVGRKGKRR